MLTTPLSLMGMWLASPPLSPVADDVYVAVPVVDVDSAHGSET